MNKLTRQLLINRSRTRGPASKQATATAFKSTSTKQSINNQSASKRLSKQAIIHTITIQLTIKYQ
jgi:hypothetical protein